LLAAEAEARGRISCNLQIAERAADTDDRVTLSIVRELVTNAVKHAQAAHVSVAVGSAAGGATRITVTDDGVGLPAARVREALNEGHVGLALVAARAEAMGGSFTLSAKPERGTTAIVTLPRTQSSSTG
jgi:signal transduction histidine kinase